MFVEGVLQQDQAVSWLNGGSVKVGPARGIPPYITYFSIQIRESIQKTLFFNDMKISTQFLKTYLLLVQIPYTKRGQICKPNVVWPGGVMQKL